MAGLGTGIALVGYGIGSELAKIGIVNVQWYRNIFSIHKAFKIKKKKQLQS